MDPLALSDALPAGDTLDSLTRYGINDVAKLAEYALSTQKKWDSSVRVPRENAERTEWETFYNKLGRPETAAGYTTPETDDGGLTMVLDSIKESAHKNGLNASAWNDISSAAKTANDSYRKQMLGTIEQRNQEWRTKAQAQYGDKMDEMVARGRDVVRKFVEQDPAVKQSLELTGLADFGPLIELLSRASEASDPSGAPPTMEGTPAMADSLSEAKELAIKARTTMRTDQFRDKRHAEHERSVSDYYTYIKRIVELGYNGASDPLLMPEYMSPQI